ncbi:hypothetical protein EDC96DRAFT_545534 [Choanephora cucurbitarum]|nr:hypothetical protein EDC96DRAFT_545534 [Choanephora cucurbitarum]
MIVSSGSSDELKQKQDNDMREFSSTSRVARQSKKEDKKKKNEKSARRIRCLSGSLIRSMTDPRVWVAWKHNLSVSFAISSYLSCLVQPLINIIMSHCNSMSSIAYIVEGTSVKICTPNTAV